MDLSANFILGDLLQDLTKTGIKVELSTNPDILRGDSFMFKLTDSKTDNTLFIRRFGSVREMVETLIDIDQLKDIPALQDYIIIRSTPFTLD